MVLGVKNRDQIVEGGKVKALSRYFLKQTVRRFVKSELEILRKKSFEEYIGGWNDASYMDMLYEKAKEYLMKETNVARDVSDDVVNDVRGDYYVAMSGF